MKRDVPFLDRPVRARDRQPVVWADVDGPLCPLDMQQLLRVEVLGGMAGIREVEDARGLWPICEKDDGVSVPALHWKVFTLTRS